jgi:carbamoyltransferase
MNILGVSFDYHDSAAALLCDGVLVGAAQEERFSRCKNDASFPSRAASYCLAQAGLMAGDLDRVVFYERPLLKLDRILRSALRGGRRGLKTFEQTAARWLVEGRLDVAGRVEQAMGVPRSRVMNVRHHASHAASAFFCSPFDEAAVVTADGVGEHETLTVFAGRGSRLEQVASQRFPHSLGLLYSGFTAYLGFDVNEGEYKIMGMAGFGEPRFAEDLRRRICVRRDGTFRLRQNLFAFDRSDESPFLPELIDWLGPPREPNSDFDPAKLGPGSRSRFYADVAASIQRVTEDLMLVVVGKAMKRIGTRNVCLAGGVALNSVANGRIQRELGCQLFVQPAAGDAGAALGAALHAHHVTNHGRRSPPLTNAFLGPAFSHSDVERALAAHEVHARSFESDQALIAHVATLLAQGQVVGWFQGRAEWGPRALGNRSILASPLTAEMQRTVNEKIKFREPFRPFAPSVPREAASTFFEVAADIEPWAPEAFMLAVCRVRPDARSQIPAVTHVDATARVHSVDRATNPVFHALLQEFGRCTGVPVLLDTSFNLRGEPIVNSPEDALGTFSYTSLDALAMGRILVTAPNRAS